MNVDFFLPWFTRLRHAASAGLLIALVACYFGLRVRPNTESLSANTTSAVVTAITTVILIDAMIEPKYLDKVLEACDGALCFASSCILGYQVYDGYVVAKAVRERYPNLPIIWGGWFPSVIPELYFEHGIADAVGIGQGELTFDEVVKALAQEFQAEQLAALSGETA
mgnify:CR=1 FL=1